MLLGINGLRDDGRRPNEPRQIETTFNLTDSRPSVSGFCRLSQGLTTVAATIIGPKSSSAKSSSANLSNDCVIKCSVSYTQFSSNERSGRSKGDRRTKVFEKDIEVLFSSVILVGLLSGSEILVDLVN